jgi:hypothetical protein
VASFDITKTNAAVDRLLDVTENPRHRYMLLAYHRTGTSRSPVATARSSSRR